MSILVAIQSAIFYYVACTPCNESRARHKAKHQAKKDRHEMMRIQMEQPERYPHPLPFHTNPYWQEEIDIGPRPPKKTHNKNTSQRALNSASTVRNSTSASLAHTNTSSNRDHSISLTSPTLSPVEPPTPITEEVWNKERYQREDEELWGHDLSKMRHRLVDNIVKAGNSAGRIIKAELGTKKQVTEEDRTDFYLTPKNPPVNDYHPPIVGSAPVHKNALQWMLQPPPPAKLMEGRVPVSRLRSVNSMAGRAGPDHRANRASQVNKTNPPQQDGITGESQGGKGHREEADLHMHEDLSESELIEVLIGRRSRRATVSSRGRRLSLESDLYSETDTEAVLHSRVTSGESDTPTPSPSSPTPKKHVPLATSTKGPPDLSAFHPKNVNAPVPAES
ncbi:hypothetical protein SODALDRAFT_339166 [Sodiomyces alkalinus F11]|uniref:Signal peptide-containing protein n=1 Tax=Sodiomyces alkalinus (strain CBS 110278 / VKM F-3762 / F11) TaxID=1314773 RepID=A0A3N2PZ78_SODAK|nr:hypothetical protein SODALDRAFT_339166 [Sodiomyces alkalinus F11]ROT39728.1 hypothetical protein SODALDRAFT_339166 [Sodiomyces alkalinus F11]